MTLADAIAASNQQRAATVYSTTDRTQAVRLRIGAAAADDAPDDPVACTAPLSIPAVMQRTAEQFGDTVALRFKREPTDAVWQSVTYR